MNNRLLTFVLVFCLIFFTGCSNSNVGDETTDPLDKIITGILTENAELYKSAFSPDYIEQVTKIYEQVNQDINTELSEIFKNALDAHSVNYGKKIHINYVLISKDSLTEKELKEPYLDLNVFAYDLPVDKITEAYVATFDITVRGNESNETKKAEYKLLKINGQWYLHPQSFMTVFS